MTTAKPTPGEPAELDALAALAQREQCAGRLAEADAAYRKILALRPDIAEAHNNLGIILWQQGKLDEAVATVRASGRSGARFCRSAQQPGQRAAGNRASSTRRRARYEQALALRPDYAEAHNNLGNILREQGKLDQAVARYRASARSPTRLRRSAQQPGQRAAGAGQARRGGGTFRASAGSQAGLCRGAQQPGQHPLAAGQARPGRGTVSSKRSLCGRTTPKRTTTWASRCGSKSS